MRIYKLKHIPTGLYYGPKKNRGGHLSKTGKFYVQKPKTPSSILLSFYFTKNAKPESVIGKQLAFFKISDQATFVNRWFQTPASDWLLEEAVVNI